MSPLYFMTIPFLNSAIVEIDYSAEMQRLFGLYPVCVVYVPDADDYIQISCQIRLRGTPTNKIIIDLGGTTASGIIIIK